MYLPLNSGMSSWTFTVSKPVTGFWERKRGTTVSSPALPHSGPQCALLWNGSSNSPYLIATNHSQSSGTSRPFCYETGIFSTLCNPACRNNLTAEATPISGKPQFQMFEALLCSYRSCFFEVTQIFVLIKVKSYLKMAGDFSEGRAQLMFKLICFVFLSLPEGLWRMWN